MNPARTFLLSLALLLAALPRLSLGASGPANPAKPFRVAQENGVAWLVSPEGKKFFSTGVCCVHQGTPRDTYDLENPGYAAWQHHTNAAAWASDTARRLKEWNFTTLGGWSDYQTLCAAPHSNLYLTPVLHIGSHAGAPWWDMWDSKNIRRMEEVARAAILPLRDDPRVIGYFSDNELGWWNATLWKMTLEQPSSSGQRQRLISLLREIYDNDWSRLAADFEPENAASWRQLSRGGTLFLRSGSNGIHTMRKFLGMLASRYYQLMRDIIRKYDTRALYLGDRYQSFYYPEVAAASAPYVDVASSNLNASWDDGTHVRCYLDTLHALTGKPIIISEFYVAAAENRSGNRNTHGGYPRVITQPQRAESARNTLQGLLRLPWVVGADWFQYFDEPTHGREDGENFNFGLVDIHDRPYEEVTAMFTSLRPDEARARLAPPRLDATQGIPPAPADPFENFTATRGLQHWDRERGYVPPATPHPVGDLYLCWSPKGLYLGLHSFDIVEPAYYRSASVPKADRALWTIRVNGHETLKARIGAGREPLHSSPQVRLENLSGLGLNVRNLAAAEIPASLFGQETLKAGDTIELHCTLATHCRAYTMEWKGKFRLADAASNNDKGR